MVTNQQGERERHFGVCFFTGMDDQYGALLTVNENDPRDWDSLPAVFTSEEDALEYAEKSYSVIINGANDWKPFVSTVVEIFQIFENCWVPLTDAYEQCFGQKYKLFESKPRLCDGCETRRATVLRPFVGFMGSFFMCDVCECAPSWAVRKRVQS